MEWVSYNNFCKLAGILTNKEYSEIVSKDDRKKLDNSLETSGPDDDETVCFSADGTSLSILEEIVKKNPDLHIASSQWYDGAGENYDMNLLTNSVHYVNRMKYFLCKGSTIDICCEERIYFDEDNSYYDDQEVFFVDGKYYDENGKILD